MASVFSTDFFSPGEATRSLEEGVHPDPQQESQEKCRQAEIGGSSSSGGGGDFIAAAAATVLRPRAPAAAAAAQQFLRFPLRRIRVLMDFVMRGFCLLAELCCEPVCYAIEVGKKESTLWEQKPIHY